MVIGHLAVKLRTAVAVSGLAVSGLALQTGPARAADCSCVEFAMSGSGH